MREKAISAFVAVGLLSLVAAMFTLGLVGSAAAQQEDIINKIVSLNWVRAPQTVDIDGKATITLSEDLEFLAPPDGDTFVALNGNPPSTGNFVLNKSDFSWFAVFSFDPSGYVKDNEKIDPDALLKTMKENDVRESEQRKRLNLEPLTLVGWYVPPRYDTQTKLLEWGTRLRSSDNTETVNYTVRLLGRTGVMHAILVSAPDTFDADVRSFKAALQNFKFRPGETYAEYRQGDRIAEYGVAALIAGGTVAVAAKAGAGFFKALMVGLFAAGAAALGFVRKLFTRK